MKQRLAYILFFLSLFSTAQEKTPILHDTLNDVRLYASTLLRAKNDSIYSFDDSLIVTQTTVLRDLLFYRTPFQIREYGQGMIAGLSLRGAPATHVQVVWNDIPLNSPLNGQTDLNALSALLADRVMLYRGGMSMRYGSGAMAGALVMENRSMFDRPGQGQIKWSGGSFGKNQFMVKYGRGNSRHYWRVGADYLYDLNRFSIPQKNYVNLHARRQQANLLIQTGTKRNSHTWEFMAFDSYNDRLLPGTVYTTSESRLIQSRQSYALRWRYVPDGKWLHAAQLSLLHEQYEYYYKPAPRPSGQGGALSLIPAYRLEYTPSKRWRGGLRWEMHYTGGHTDAYTRHERTVHYLTAYAHYERGRWQGDAALGTVAGPYRLPLTGFVHVGRRSGRNAWIYLNLSSNYRLPTFNDLYWEPGGNPSLMPEQTYEAEQGFRYRRSGFTGQIALFYRYNLRLIRWVPLTPDYWRPFNIDRSVAAGAETDIRWQWHWGAHGFSLDWHHVAQSARDIHTGFQVPYVPRYLWNAGLSWQWKQLRTSLLHRYQSFYYIDPANRTWVHAYKLWHLMWIWTDNRFTWVAGIDNLFNTYYELMPARPMPGRSFYLSFIWNFQSNNKNKRL